jgi:hypothetical protein
MTIAKIFKATLPSVNYIFKNGKPAIFVNGKFHTSIPAEIQELEAEIAAGHPILYIDSAEAEVDSTKVDPIAGLRESIIAEYKASMAAATNPDNNMGDSAQDPLKPSSTNAIQDAAAGGSGVGLAARLMKVGK